MSKAVWARLMKQQEQQQESSQSKLSDYQVHKYKNIILSPKQQQLNILADQPQHMNVNILYNTTASVASSLSATSPPPISGSILHDQEEIRASRLLQIVRRWKTQSGTKQITARARRSTTRSPSCSMLNFVPLSCITFSSIHLHSDLEDDDDDDENMASASCRKNANIRSPQLHHRACERKIRAAPARRALSCPKLSSPLSSCTAFPRMHGDEPEQEEYLECLQPKQEEDGRIKLKRSSSSPMLRKHNILSKKASTPKGYLAIYVGEERRRFLVKANLLNHPLFSILLEKAKEEFGFDQKGPLNIPCDIAFFQHIMLLVESNDPSYKNADHSSILLHFNSPNQLAAASVV